MITSPSVKVRLWKGQKALISMLLVATALANVQYYTGHGRNVVIKYIAQEPESQLISFLYAVILSYNVQNLKRPVI
jgi:hypothetical protein